MNSALLTGFGVVSAILYAAGLAFGAESLARTSVALLYVAATLFAISQAQIRALVTPDAARAGA